MKYIILIISAYLLIIICSCSPTEVVFEKNQISLDVDAEVTETWVTLRSTPVEKNAVYYVTRDDSLIFQGKLTQSDTLIHDENLEPSRTYNYAAYANKAGEQSKTVTATAITMDTTSHDFVWETFEFGGRSSSILNDVTIINESDIWAVGKIHTEDTDRWNEDSTEWIPGFNAIHWDGNEWELKHITVDFRGNSITPLLEGVLAFSPSDIWFAGSLPIYGDGTNWGIFDVRTTTDPNLSLSKIWGTTSKDIYFVGKAGSIAHFNGQTWTKIESGTDIDIRDIYGAENEKTGGYEILGVASNVSTDKQIKFFQIKDKKVVDLPMDGLTHFFDGIWFKPNSKYYIVGSGIFENNRLYKTRLWYDFPHGLVSSFHIEAIAANDINDIITVGSYNEVVHFNGNNWNNYKNNIFAAYYEVDLKNNTVVAVGFNGRNAQILMGRR